MLAEAVLCCSQVLSLQDSLAMASQVMNAFCQLPASQALLLSQSSSASQSAASGAPLQQQQQLFQLTAGSTNKLGEKTASHVGSSSSLNNKSSNDNTAAALSESLSSLTSSITALTSNIVTTGAEGSASAAAGTDRDSPMIEGSKSVAQNAVANSSTTSASNGGCSSRAAADCSSLGNAPGAAAVAEMSACDLNSTAHDVSTLSHDVSTLSHDVSTLSHDSAADLSESSQSSLSCGSLSETHPQPPRHSSCVPAPTSAPQRPSSLPVCRDVSQHR